MGHLIAPHGGVLINLICPRDEADALKRQSIDYPSIDLSARQLCDLELLMNGGFSPLTGFMNRTEYEAVLEGAALPNGLVWPIPVVLDVPEKTALGLEPGQNLALRDMEGFMLAVMTIEDIWQPDKTREAISIYSTDSLEHPGVENMLNAGSYYIGGRIRGIQPPLHYDYKMLRQTPSEVRTLFQKLGWRRIMGFETSKPLHNAHKEMTLLASRENNANIFLHPIVGSSYPGDIDHYARVRCYEAIINTYPPDSAILGLLPLALRMAGPKEALWHAIIRKNYGCTHFMVAGDHADPFALPTSKKRFYPIGAAQRYVAGHEDAVGVTMVAVKKMVYIPARAQYIAAEECGKEGGGFTELSATELRRRLDFDLDIPAWFSPPAVVAVLRKAYPARSRQGFTVFLTGLSGSGKSTIAKLLMSRFMQIGDRPVTLLDGDIVRKNLSSELGFSEEHRILNIIRIGFVASEITKNGGIAICAPIAPLQKARQHNRRQISRYGGYIEVYVATPLAVCEQRDRKGLYAKARKGQIKGFTGIDDPYDPPDNPEVVIDTTSITPDEAAEEVLFFLKKNKYIN